MKDETRECSEIVAPDLQGNPWPHPMGYPIILSNERAYYFACYTKNGRGKILKDKLKEVHQSQERLQTQVAGDGDLVSPSDVLDKQTELAAMSLSLQYCDETLGQLEDYLDAKNLNMITAAIVGFAPGYEVTVKKN